MVDIGQREFALGLTYVALSRVKSLEGLLLHPISNERISRLRGFEFDISCSMRKYTFADEVNRWVHPRKKLLRALRQKMFAMENYKSLNDVPKGITFPVQKFIVVKSRQYGK